MVTGASGTNVAYVLVWDGTTWVEQAKLTPSDSVWDDGFGSSIGISGDTVVVGSPRNDHTGRNDPGAAFVFTRSGGVWTQEAKLITSGPNHYDYFGWSVAIDGDTIVIGAIDRDFAPNSDAGGAYIFTRSGSIWTEQALLIPSDPTTMGYFGWSSLIRGDTIMIGAPGATGGVYVFQGSGASWSQQVKLTEQFPQYGGGFGSTLDIDGTTLAIGAPSENAAYIFTGSGASWTQEAKLRPQDTSHGAVGSAIALDGDLLVSGGSSIAFLFIRDGTTWSEDRFVTWAYQFGKAVAIKDQHVYGGAPGTTVSGASSAGAIQDFRLIMDVDMSATQTASPNPAFAGGNVTYTVTATNNSPDPTTGVWIVAFLPPDVPVVSVLTSTTCYGPFSDDSLYCDMGGLSSGESKSVQIILRPPQIGAIGNIAVALSDAPDANSDNDSSFLPVGIFVASSQGAAPVLGYQTTFTPTLTWNRVNGSINYEIELSTSPVFSAAGQIGTLTVPGNQLSVTISTNPTLTIGQVYYWRVRAQDANGKWDNWSAGETLQVNAYP
jgi:uncharacterized repeat protein (TIGR01451 family)